MKRISFFTSIILVFLLCASNIAAQSFTGFQKEAIARNLIKGIHSDNPGLRTSAALRIFQLIEDKHLNKDRFSDAVLPLMKMLSESISESEKIAAALSLYKIEDKRGIYYLRGAAIYDESEKVRLVGKNLYYNFHLANGSTYLVDLK